jgi:hypothetical protein
MIDYWLPETTKPTEKIHDLTTQSIAPGKRAVLVLEDDLTFANRIGVRTAYFESCLHCCKGQ